MSLTKTVRTAAEQRAWQNLRTGLLAMAAKIDEYAAASRQYRFGAVEDAFHELRERFMRDVARTDGDS